MNKAIILKDIKEQVAKVGNTIQAMPWGEKAFYSAWCAQTYKYVTHSAPLIKLCAERLPPGKMKDDMSHHHAEEHGHERYAERDAKFFGLDAVKAVELPETAGIYASIYKEIEDNPAAMFGYALALESLSKKWGPYIAKVVVKSYKIKASKHHEANIPASFLTLHADVDQEHADEGIAAIDRIEGKDLKVVHRVMLKTFENYAKFLTAIEKANAHRKTG